MPLRLLADIAVVLHLLFIAFVIAGGLLALRWPRAAWVHLPCAAWGIAIEFTGWICPLTPLENHWRVLGGQTGYAEGFIAHYLSPIIYPEGLTRSAQLALGAGVILANAAIYGLLIARRRRSNRETNR
ncbi:MAG TPA: DUF2784 domain-containing protein [Candidatus Krumholzibacteria bacterium]|nr:DUF2784 domain-containing protein [Candidatus Krumholzibacteria bacterium]HPD71916.1 DUF2784 domain-containing protein [Candidatus Krumholzibacteria bacterium]HRY41151.1 DUF2784 domain-containing protein [Candidatus Krumholzibacteria bacterium]